MTACMMSVCACVHDHVHHMDRCRRTAVLAWLGALQGQAGSSLFVGVSKLTTQAGIGRALVCAAVCVHNRGGGTWSGLVLRPPLSSRPLGFHQGPFAAGPPLGLPRWCASMRSWGAVGPHLPGTRACTCAHKLHAGHVCGLSMLLHTQEVHEGRACSCVHGRGVRLGALGGHFACCCTLLGSCRCCWAGTMRWWTAGRGSKLQNGMRPAQPRCGVCVPVPVRVCLCLCLCVNMPS